MEQVIKLFIALIRSEICQLPPDREAFSRLTHEQFGQLYMVAVNHDLTHVVAMALKRQGLLGNDQISSKYLKNIYHVLMRHEHMNYELNQIRELFEKEKIPYVPLKGSVIKKLYPEEWMRTSCDIDILVPLGELERAKKILMEQKGYVLGQYKYHDISLYAPSGILLELHFKILENQKNMDRTLEKVWEYVRPVKEQDYCQSMIPEYLLFHSYAHMLYHFLNGGCGVRFVVDIWLMEHKMSYDERTFQKLCKESKIGTFVQYVRKLSRVWFEEEEHDTVTRRMESYIMTGGVFGNNETKVTARKTRMKGKYTYLFKRIFIPYGEFLSSYPKLEKYPFLYPYYTVHRWFKMFNKQTARDAIQEIKISNAVRQEDVDELEYLFRELKI